METIEEKVDEKQTVDSFDVKTLIPEGMEFHFATPAVEENFLILLEKIYHYHPDADWNGICSAFKMAAEAHKDQWRQSGEPYIIHPLKVALNLTDLELDTQTIQAGLLHDVVEDTPVTLIDIAASFGSDVANLVDGVTKLKTLTYTSTSKEEIQAENYRKLFMAMAKDIRVILIKLADRLHNLRTLEYKSKEKQYEKAKETLDIYAPIANRLGISKFKIDLEDLSLKYLDPEAYANLTAQIMHKRDEREKIIQGICQGLRERLEEGGIHATVEGRPKHFFSIYKKMVNKHYTLDQIYDLFAVRAIVDNIKDCYGALGIIHDAYTPVPGRFKDYIAMPKSNMYQSLHTTLIGPTGEPFEVQIRTWEMHTNAQYGIAAHWLYKAKASGLKDAQAEKERMTWLTKLLDVQNSLSDNHEFMDVVKEDLNVFSESVFAFSPKGDVIEMPAGSTPVDFAYQIHSAVGHKMVGARVNGKLVPLDYKIRNGEQLEIITSQNSKGPSRDWLKFVKTTGARNKIIAWYKKESRTENIQRGKELLEHYAKTKALPWPQLQKPEFIEAVCKKYGFADWDSLTASVGHGGLKEGQVVNRLNDEYKKYNLDHMTDDDVLKLVPNKIKEDSPEKTRKNGSAIIVKGLHDLAVRFSRCCDPVPGDEIVGYVTRGRGVSIHRTDCVNIMSLPEVERERLIEAQWEVHADHNMKFQTNLQIVGEERLGLLVDVSTCINSLGMTILSLDARVNKEQTEGNITVTLEITSKEQLAEVTTKLSQIRGVREIIRKSK